MHKYTWRLPHQKLWTWRFLGLDFLINNSRLLKKKSTGPLIKLVNFRRNIFMDLCRRKNSELLKKIIEKLKSMFKSWNLKEIIFRDLLKKVADFWINIFNDFLPNIVSRIRTFIRGIPDWKLFVFKKIFFKDLLTKYRWLLKKYFYRIPHKNIFQGSEVIRKFFFQKNE